MKIPDPSAKTMVRVHWWAMTVWTGLLFPTVALWSGSIRWVVFMSWYANWVGHFSALDAARAQGAAADTRKLDMMLRAQAQQADFLVVLTAGMGHEVITATRPYVKPMLDIVREARKMAK